MKSVILFSIEQVSDDDTGIWKVGELEFGIHQELYDYIQKYGENGLKNIRHMVESVLSSAQKTVERRKIKESAY